MNQQPHPNPADKIKDLLEKGDLKMKSKTEFWLKNSLYAFSLILVFLFAAYLLSLIMFFGRENDLLFSLGFGIKGALTFILAAPWLFIIFFLFFFGLFEFLIRKYSFAWKRPHLYTLAIAIILLVIVGEVSAKIRLHEILAEKSRRAPLPITTHIYRRLDSSRPKHLHRGTIKTFLDHDNEFVIIEKNGRESSVTIFRRDSILPPGVATGTEMIIFGQRKGGLIEAEKIKIIRDTHTREIKPHRPLYQ